MTVPVYLTTQDVMTRYGLRDPRAARAIMRDAGCIRAGRKLLVSQERLGRHDEANLIIDSPPGLINDQPMNRLHRPKPGVPGKLDPGWLG